ncbi:MAG: hypothetical protein EA422_15560 [Gemmatimonadales bacterium]|nr:MAG: hypothetical protein EA422_15560 [Gemmatimonadales bacterium]
MRSAKASVVIFMALAAVLPAAGESGLSAQTPDSAVAVGQVGAPAGTPAGIPDELRDPDTRSQALARILEVADSRDGPIRTLWVQGLAVAEKTTPETGARAIEALLRAEAGEAQAGAWALAEWPGHDEMKGDDWAALLALAARLLDADDPEGGAELRERLLAAYPAAPEAVETRLRLARYLADQGSDEDRARALTLVEDLIVEAPDHPLAPEARRFLAELRRGA